jgi:hypothetical protein
MNNRAECDECRAITQQLMRDLAEVGELSPKLKDQLRARCEALFGMMSGLEEDLERAEGVLDKFQIGPQRPGLIRMDTMRSMFEHLARTGHRVLFRK